MRLGTRNIEPLARRPDIQLPWRSHLLVGFALLLAFTVLPGVTEVFATDPAIDSPGTAASLTDSMSIGTVSSCVDLDPNQDGWTTEAISERVNKQLAILGGWLANADADPSVLDSVLAQDVVGSLPKYPSGEPDVRTVSVSVWRDKSEGTAPERISSGAGEWREAWAQWFSELRRCDQPHVKFKVVGVTLEGTKGTTRQLFSADGFFPPESAEFAAIEMHAVVTCIWHIRDGGDPELERIELSGLEVSRLHAGYGRWLVDRGPFILAGVREYKEQLLAGFSEWMRRVPGFMLAEFGHHGLAIGDVNGDELEDIYVCQPGGFPNLLIVQQPDGTAKNMAPEAGVDFLDLSRSALLVDLDNDRDADLVIATSNRLVVMANNGQGQFKPMGTFRNVRDANSITASDFDQDGDLDIYACIYSHDGDISRGSPTPIPIHDARNGGKNLLLRNDGLGPDGEWQMVDVTSEVGLDEDNDRWSYAACWEDYDDDGDPDLIVANDFGRNNLYRNDGGKFRNVATEAGLDTSAFGMSAAWGDYDHDGRMDLYIGNMFSGAGNRITDQPAFQSSADDGIRRDLRRAAQGNALFRNLGNGKFQNVAEELGVQYGRWAWGSVFADLNNDSWEEILVANGFVTSDDPDDL
jgi:FG-GAP-like repeat